MKPLLPLSIPFLVFVVPSQMFAKADIVKITIKGARLKTPIDITDPKLVANFQVWSGPGTGSSSPEVNLNTPGFIVDWAHAPQKPPKGLACYQISFWRRRGHDLPRRRG